MVIIETTIFTKRVGKILNEEDYRKLQNILIDRPDAGKIIQSSGGIRKLRWLGSSRGKRGGSRVIYYYLNSKSIIVMLLIYSKNETTDLTPRQLAVLKQIVKKEFKNER